MNKVQPISRRVALMGALASSAALAIPAAAALHVNENPYDKVRRLQRELSDALAEVIGSYGHDYVAVTRPAGTAQYCRDLIDRDVYDWATSAGPHEVANHHLLNLAATMQKIHGGGFRALIDGSTRQALVVGDQKLEGVWIDNRRLA